MIRIQQKDFDSASEMRRMLKNRTDVGAAVSFVGLVRDMAKNERITSMILEHYPGMTEKELARIEAEARQRWRLLDCLIVHRVGPLAPGEQIVLVITLSAHRQDAYLANEFIMDYLKTSAPFWKKEQGEDGDADWVDARETDFTARAKWRRPPADNTKDGDS